MISTESFQKKINELGEKSFKECKGCQQILTFIKNTIAATVYFVCICIISRNNIVKGLTTFYFFVCIFGYAAHYFIHKYKCFYTICHHYHHYYTTFFACFIEVAHELCSFLILYPVYHFTGTKYFDIWAIVYYFLMYTTIHNINYGYLRVNNFHRLHHENPLTNYGPDYCDIFFNTKNQKEPEMEDTLHYIPNAVISAVIVLGLQYICLNKSYEDFFKKVFIWFEVSLLVICILSGIYIYIYHPDICA